MSRSWMIASIAAALSLANAFASENEPSCCGDLEYDPATEECCGGVVVELGNCCNGEEMDSYTEECCDGQIVAKGECCNGEVLAEGEMCCRLTTGEEFKLDEDNRAVSVKVTIDNDESSVFWHGQSRTFTASASGGCPEYTYKWTVPGDQGDDPPTTASVSHTFADAGEYPFSVEVTDKVGTIESGSISVNSVKVWANAVTNQDDVREGSDNPVKVHVVVNGIDRSAIDTDLELKPVTSSIYNSRGGSVGTVTFLGEGENEQEYEYEVYPLWYTGSEGGCARSNDENVTGDYNVKVSASYNGELLGTEENAEIKVWVPVTGNHLVREALAVLAEVSEPEEAPAVNGWRCQIVWNGAWSEKQGHAEFDYESMLAQYADMIKIEEDFHVGQWTGSYNGRPVTRQEGGDSDLYTEKGTRYQVGMIGNGTWYFYGETPVDAIANATARLVEAVREERSTSEGLLGERRGVAEFKAKEEAGFMEGITYECEYGSLSSTWNPNHPAFD